MTKPIALIIICLFVFSSALSSEESNDTPENTALHYVHYDQTERFDKEEDLVSDKHAIAVVSPKRESEVAGAVTFSEVEGGVRILADFAELSPGKHGFHIHEHGDCSAEDASSAGGHFNPTNQKHGGPDSSERHVGDLGNLDANEFGFAHYDRVDSVISLRGEHSIIGKSVIIHEEEDDLTTDPTGNAGKRIGCGVIVETDL